MSYYSHLSAVAVAMGSRCRHGCHPSYSAR
uniref:Uncharacterized protein n=1 Tax=Macaca nemestrina TaxID=9545 RepID=A0A2K6E3H1_MACNE